MKQCSLSARNNGNAVERLLHILRAMGPLCVALSGGLDSRFLTHAALDAGCDVLAVHAAGPHVPEAESAWARAWAATRHVAFAELRVNPLEIPEVLENGRERCYFCKRGLMAALRETAGTRLLCDGTNADDLGQWRPGLRALREAGIRSPLAEAGLSKAEIQRWGAASGLEHPDQTARPCLLTRWAYGLHPDMATLERLAGAEQALQALGLKEFRLRLTPAPLLQTAPLTPELRVAALRVAAEYGFSGTTLLEETQVGGFFDRPSA